jgi:gephyrin
MFKFVASLEVFTLLLLSFSTYFFRAQIMDNMPLDPRPEFHRVHIRATSTGLKAYSTGGQRSSRVTSLAGANGLVALPARPKSGEGKQSLLAGENAIAMVIGEIQSELI